MSETEGKRAPGDARRLDRFLVRAIWIATLVLLAFTAFLVWQVTGAPKPPRVLSPAEQRAEEIKAQLKLAKNAKSPDLHNQLGEMYYLMGDESGARKEFETALKYRKDFGPSVRNLVSMAWIAGDQDKAMADLKAYLARQEADAEAWFLLGTYQQDKQLWADAATSYTQSLERNKTDSVALHRLGVCLEEQGKKDEAIARYKESLKYVPDYEPALEALTRLGVDK